MPSSLPRRAARAAARQRLALATVVLAACSGRTGRSAQWADYHDFADERAWLGLPNAANVLSNLPFLAVGAWALWRLRRAPAASPSLAPGARSRVALVLTAVGSSAYHWAPVERQPGRRPAADRLGLRRPGCRRSSASASARTGAGARMLGAALALATLAVAFWWLTERAGQGDLRL